MNAAAGHRGHGFASSVAFSAARGAALIAIAVVIGVVLLQVVDTGNGGPVGDGGTKVTGSKPDATTPTSAPPTSGSTTPAPAVRPPGEVQVLVLNGSGVAGAAGRLTTALKTDGYVTGATPLAPADTARRQGTVVYFRPGFDAEAGAVAAKVAAGTPTQALPDPPPPGTVSQAEVIVVLGT